MKRSGGTVGDAIALPFNFWAEALLFNVFFCVPLLNLRAAMVEDAVCNFVMVCM